MYDIKKNHKKCNLTRTTITVLAAVMIFTVGCSTEEAANNTGEDTNGVIITIDETQNESIENSSGYTAAVSDNSGKEAVPDIEEDNETVTVSDEKSKDDDAEGKDSGTSSGGDNDSGKTEVDGGEDMKMMTVPVGSLSNIAKGRELIASASSDKEAEEIAKAYGIELVEYRYGVATFHTEEDPASVIKRGEDKGLPKLALNNMTVLDDPVKGNDFELKKAH